MTKARSPEIKAGKGTLATSPYLNVDSIDAKARGKVGNLVPPQREAIRDKRRRTIQAGDFLYGAISSGESTLFNPDSKMTRHSKLGNRLTQPALNTLSSKEFQA